MSSMEIEGKTIEAGGSDSDDEPAYTCFTKPIIF